MNRSVAVQQAVKFGQRNSQEDDAKDKIKRAQTLLRRPSLATVTTAVNEESQRKKGPVCCAGPRRRIRSFCQILCKSRLLAVLTTLLTFYALFGDDLRLMFSNKAEDTYFDWVTIAAMAVFSIELLAFSGGKPEYMFGFFFWLDLLATVTLVLDVTVVGEQLFGDSISNAASASSSDGGGTGNSAEAARAARMSRAGTKAGRVVRLIRLLRLIKMLKVFRKDTNQIQNIPGEDDYDDDDEEAQIQESAVSKKLSEMTTRRVIVLVLAIMLFLPVFQADMLSDNFDTAGQFGMNTLYRRWRDGMDKYLPEQSAQNHMEYMESTERQVYEDLLLLYLYKHNWFLRDQPIPSDKSSPKDSFNRLFWLGASPADSSLAKYVAPKLVNYDWNSRWNGKDWDFYSGDIPSDIQATLLSSWNDTQLCVHDLYRGRSLLATQADEIRCPEELRYQERTAIFPQLLTSEEATQISFMFVFDRRHGSKYEAMLNLFQTLFVCLLLGIASLTFSNDANKLVLAPIERIISKLDKIRNNPLQALKIGDDDHHKEEVRAAKLTAARNTWAQQKSRSGSFSCLDRVAGGGTREQVLSFICPMACCKRRLGLQIQAKEQPEPMETQVLERTIIKIGSLLALGFGEAGAQIIGQNMKDNDSSSVMGGVSGRRVDAVFAFCNIRDFTVVTEVLQDQVMIFVNRIAALVHSLCDEYWGNPNKNVGDAFLLVWRLSGQPDERRHRLTDLALLALLSMVAKVAKSHEIAEYREHHKLLKRLPQYRVRLSFGVHVGWAIEGAIGSDFKIDASYLSPNVNFAAKLESDTKYYGSKILMSGTVIDALSQPLGQMARLIDSVDYSGSGNAMKVYSMDLDDTKLRVEEPFAAPLTKAARFKLKFERQRRKNERWAETYNAHQVLSNEPSFKIMREKFTEEFFCRFQMAYLNYEAGNWPIACKMLEETRFLCDGNEDGASCALLRMLLMHDNEAPKDWRGYRPFGVIAIDPLNDELSSNGDRPPEWGSSPSGSSPARRQSS
jgi:class 3 adenylate cyclase